MILHMISAPSRHAAHARNVRLLACGILIALLLAPTVSATTEVRVVKLAADGSSVIDETTVDFRWMETNLPVQGDGVTHYYHQGPTFDESDPWNPDEDTNVESRDFGAVKGTAVRDLCDLVGGMAPGDAVRIRADDGFSKTFDYPALYQPSPRQGTLVLTWYRAGDGYGDTYYEGMRTVFFADTSTNPWGYHVFGNWDMHESLPEARWHYFGGEWPSSSGLSVKYVSEIAILTGEGSNAGTGGSGDDDGSWIAETGSLNVTSSPPGARIIIDDDPTDRVTNATISDLPAGTYAVRVEDPNFSVPADEWVEIRAGATSRVHFDGEPLRGGVEIRSVPAGAWIAVDGTNTSRRTNATLDDLSVGIHTLTVSKDGYLPAHRTIPITGDPDGPVIVCLTPAYSETDGAAGVFRLGATGSVRGEVDLIYWALDTGPLFGGTHITANLPAGTLAAEGVVPVRLLVYADKGRDTGSSLPKEPRVEVSVDGRLLFPDSVLQARTVVDSIEYIAATRGYAPPLCAGTEAGPADLTVANTGDAADRFSVPGIALVRERFAAGGAETRYWLYEAAGVALGNGTSAVLPFDSGTAGGDRATLVVVMTPDAPESIPSLFFNGEALVVPEPEGAGGLLVASFDLGVLPRNGTGILEMVSEGADAGDVLSVRTVLFSAKRAAPAEAMGESGESGLIAFLKERILGPLTRFVESLLGPPTAAPGGPLPDPASPETPGEPREHGETAENASLTVASSPPGARIFLDGIYTGRITPWTFTGPLPGLHRIGLEEEDYLFAEQEVESGGADRVMITLAPDPAGNLMKARFDLGEGVSPDERTGGLFIDSLPGDAAIVLDGKATGARTPHLFAGLKQGYHRVQVLRGTDDATTGDQTVWVYPGAVMPVLIDLTAPQQEVEINLTSGAFAGVAFSIDGRYPAQAFPATTTVRSFGSTVAVHRDGVYHAFWLGGVSEGETIVVEPSGTPLATLLVTSDPPGGEIILDGVRTGYATPYLLDDLTGGYHTIVVTKSGYLPGRRMIRMVALDQDPDATVDFALTPYPYGSLRVTGVPGGAKIYLHNRNTGMTTPATFTHLPIGTYQVGIAWNTTVTAQREVTVHPFETTECTAGGSP